jgi:hypothetical protein
MSRLGLLFLFLFGLSAIFLGRTGDGQILLAFLAWPSSYLTGFICGAFSEWCGSAKNALLLIILFGLFQYYLLGYLIEKLVRHLMRRRLN